LESFKDLNKKLLSEGAESLLSKWLPNGKKNGREYKL